MQLRRTSGRACVHIGLAAVVLALVVSPTALGVAEKPKPDALWQAFPLEPAGKRPASPLLPPAQERVEGRAEATTAVTVAPSEDSRPDLLVLALATLLLLVATVVALSGRRLYVRRRHRTSVPLWQGVTWPHAPDNVRQLREAGVRTSSGLVGREGQPTKRLPDVVAPRYRWADKSPARRARPSAGVDVGMMIHRLRRAIWTEDSAPAIVGGVVAFVLGVLLVYLIG
jgi:hypothetical protein